MECPLALRMEALKARPSGEPQLAVSSEESRTIERAEQKKRAISVGDVGVPLMQRVEAVVAVLVASGAAASVALAAACGTLT